MATEEVFKLKPFIRFAHHEGIEDELLLDAIRRADAGLVDADLGGGVIKQRVPRRNQGRSGGFRTIVLFRRDERAFFAYGFAKSERDNITASELGDFRKLAEELFGATQEELQVLLDRRAIVRIRRRDE